MVRDLRRAMSIRMRDFMQRSQRLWLSLNKLDGCCASGVFSWPCWSFPSVCVTDGASVGWRVVAPITRPKCRRRGQGSKKWPKNAGKNKETAPSQCAHVLRKSEWRPNETSEDSGRRRNIHQPWGCAPAIDCVPSVWTTRTLSAVVSRSIVDLWTKLDSSRMLVLCEPLDKAGLVTRGHSISANSRANGEKCTAVRELQSKMPGRTLSCFFFSSFFF
ncbi:hypothetical protein DIPPA_64795 [Diplonema papillatum]|nr:hypothetical protein DIPPA_64795 [Diplonema papillatum]